MASNSSPKPGKALEDLVAAIETILCGDGKFEVLRNQTTQYKRTPFAEFDVIVKGKAGSNPVYALIECRDRKGRAPNNWIHQLAGKKDFHGFTSVAAVSTSGFAKGCEAVAARAKIDLRTVNTLTPENVLSEFEGITSRNFAHGIGLRRGDVRFVKETPVEVVEAAGVILKDPVECEGPHFFMSSSGRRLSLRDCFYSKAIPEGEMLRKHWEKVGPGANLRIMYGKPNILEFITPAGVGRVGEIYFFYDFETTVTTTPPSAVRNYASQTTGEAISQTMEFDLEIPEHGIQKILIHAVPTDDATVISMSLVKPPLP